MNDLEIRLERVERERDTLIQMLASELDWDDTSYIYAMMHVEPDIRSLKASLAMALKKRDDALAKADQYERDWYDAKSEFGTSMAKMRAERDEYKSKLDAELPAMWKEDIESLNQCLERVENERQKAVSVIAQHERTLIELLKSLDLIHLNSGSLKDIQAILDKMRRDIEITIINRVQQV
jgi:hypothetical protein